MEAASGGPPVDPRAPWAYEFSSIVMVIALAPFIGWMVWKVPWDPGMPTGGWARFAGLHALGACAFSVAHIAGMVLLRTGAFALAGETYDFTYRGDVWLPFFYEWRKDVLTYAAIAASYWAWGFWQAQKAAQQLVAPAVTPAQDQRIEIRDGGRVTLLDPASIGWVEAAGNYVEIHAGGASHLVRGTLAGFEERLAAHGFVKVHRSRLLNRAKVASFKPTAAGDLEITLDDGSVIAGSRRFRAAVEG
jgi:hypothetical protein